ncbi:hypothetical protein P3T25_005724 [Paraburkholderia sp. GAS32]
MSRSTVFPGCCAGNSRTHPSSSGCSMWKVARVARNAGYRVTRAPCRYRLAFSLPPVPAPGAPLPLVLSARRTRFGQWKGVRHRVAIWDAITGQWDEAFAHARATGRDVDEKELKQFAGASTHWRRHSYAKGLPEALKYGLDARSALENMGHADQRTFN